MYSLYGCGYDYVNVKDNGKVMVMIIVIVMAHLLQIQL